MHWWSQNQNCNNIQCTGYLRNDVWIFSRSAYSNSEKSPWKYDLSVSILNPESVIRGVQFLYKLCITWSWVWQENMQCMKNCDNFLSSPWIAANFLKDFDQALSFKLRSALYCPIIGSPPAINWCRDSTTEIGRKIVKTAWDVNFFMFHNAENVYQQYTG